MTHEYLVAKVAKAIAAADQDGMTDLVVYEDYYPMARAAIAVVVEECARACEDAWEIESRRTRDDFAEKLRAMIEGGVK